MKSNAKWRASLAAMTPAERALFITSLTPHEARYLAFFWPVWARDKQLPPAGHWRVWLLLAGRGFGKTRAGAEWIRWLAETGQARHIGLVGDTADDVRHVMIEGASGILRISPPDQRPHYYKSQRKLVWPSGAIARCYSADDPEQLRGPEFDFAWADEIAKWRYPAAWDNLMFALRGGDTPQVLATTTPRMRQWLVDLSTAPDTVMVQGATMENQANLAPGFLRAITARYQGSALGRQELDGLLLAEHEGALWSVSGLAACRHAMPARDSLFRIVVGVDPALGGPGETGIVVAGKDKQGMIWILEDASCAGQPDIWINRVRQCFDKWRAEAVIAEINQGGALVRRLLQTTGPALPIREVRAMRAKAIRAEPVAAAYANGLVRHAGDFPALEGQMCACLPGLPPTRRQTPSPDRLDALVWAVNALLSGTETTAFELTI